VKHRARKSSECRRIKIVKLGLPHGAADSPRSLVRVGRPGISPLGEVTPAGTDGAFAVTAPDVLVVPRATRAGEFPVGADPKIPAFVIVAIRGDHASVAGGVDQALIGEYRFVAGLIVGTVSDEGSGHGFHIPPAPSLPFVIFGLLFLPGFIPAGILLLGHFSVLLSKLLHLPVLPLVVILDGFHLQGIALLVAVGVVLGLFVVAVVVK